VVGPLLLPHLDEGEPESSQDEQDAGTEHVEELLLADRVPEGLRGACRTQTSSQQRSLIRLSTRINLKQTLAPTR
jgi:hypothetical protein